MDKNEEKEREVKKEENATNLETVTLPVAPEYGKAIKDLLEAMDKSDANALSLINKDARSMFSNKRTLNYIATLVEYIHRAARISVIAYFSADYLNRRLDILEQVAVILLHRMEDLPAPADVKKLSKISKQITEMDSLIKKLKEFKEQADKEKTDAFKKLDATRQQILRDAIV